MKNLLFRKHYLVIAMLMSILLSLHLGAYFMAKYQINSKLKQLSRQLRVIDTLEALQFRDSAGVVVHINLQGSCSLVENGTRLRVLDFAEKIQYKQVAEPLCHNLLAMQTLRSSGVLDGVYIAYQFMDSVDGHDYLMTSGSFPLDYANKAAYREFLMEDNDLYFHKDGIIRKLYVKTSLLPDDSPQTQANPYFLQLASSSAHQYISTYLEEINNTGLSYAPLRLRWYLLPLLCLLLLLWRSNISLLQRHIWNRKSLKHLKHTGFASFKQHHQQLNVLFSSDFTNTKQTKLRCYTERGKICDKASDEVRFVKVSLPGYEAVYRLLGEQRSAAYGNIRIGIRDEKQFELIRFYEGNYTRDSLTGLHNRAALNTFIKQHANSDTQFLMALVDLDHFKSFNDTYGHEFGDTLLVHTASYLKRNFKNNRDDLLLRVGGEEFLVLLNVSQSNTDITTLSEKLQTRLLGFNQQAISLSGGIALWQCANESFDTAYKRADELLYRSKAKGRKQISLEPGLTSAPQCIALS
ncbi:GGDEF domain-containing protein [Agarivorans sp.]|uniref:GGDEF domain-containing protein n=1 Tax=Agarivorans sp. TaxID=1872412 RepID=UPI003D064E89